MDDIIRIIKSLENYCVLTDGVSETVKHEIKNIEGEFLDMLLLTLGASLLWNMSIKKGVIKNKKGVTRTGREHTSMGHADKDF